MLSPSPHRASYPQVFQGVLERNMKRKLFLTGKVGAKLDILLENMGRLSFGSNHSDFKVSWLCLPCPHTLIDQTLLGRRGLMEDRQEPCPWQ